MPNTTSPMGHPGQRPPSRRRLLQALPLLASALLGACAPATSLPPLGGRAGRFERKQALRPVTGADSTPETRSKTAEAHRPTPVPHPTASTDEAARTHRPGSQSRIVRFLHSWDGSRTAAVEGAIADFEQQHPGLQVEADIIPADHLRDALIGAAASGATPDVVVLRSDGGPYLLEQGLVAPLNTLLGTAGIGQGRFPVDEWSMRTWDGHVAGLPHVLAGAEQLLYVNTALLERLDLDPTQPFQTWQQVEALAEPARRNGLLAIDPTRCAWGVPALQVWTYANGGRWLTDFNRRIAWDEPPVIEAAEWLQRLTFKQRGAGTPPIGDRPREPVSLAEWLEERHVCCINGADWIPVLQQSAPQLPVAVFELPRNEANPASDGRSPSFGGWMLSLSAATKDRDAAWSWLAFLGASEAADRLAQAQGRRSPRAPLSAYDQVGMSRPFEGVVAAARSRSTLVPQLPVSTELDESAIAAQTEMLAQQSPAAASIEKATSTAQRRLDEWLAHRQSDRGPSAGQTP